MRCVWLFLLFTGAISLAAQEPDILYYKFNETSGSTAQNSAVPGQGFSNATFSSAPNWNATDPHIGAACVDNNNLQRRLSTGYSLSERNNQPFTIEFWFRTGASGYQDFVNDSSSFGIWLYNGQLQVWLGNAVQLQSSGRSGGRRLADGQWHYCALTHDGATSFTLYWGHSGGGLASTSGSANVTFSNLALELLHWQAAVPGTFDGEMDEFRLWGVQRTAGQLAGARHNEIALQGVRDFDVFDSTGGFVPPQGTVSHARVDDATFTDYTFTLTSNRTSGDVSFGPATLPTLTGATGSIVTQPSTIGPGASTTMTVRITPTAPEFSVTVHVNHNRSPNPYAFTLAGITDTGRPEILYYRLNEGTGTQAANEGDPGRGDNPGSFTSGPAWNTVDPQLGAASAIGNAALPTGFHATDLSGSKFTIEFWMRTGGNGTIVGDGQSWRIYLQGGDLQVDAGAQTIDPNNAATNGLNDNNWHHLAVVSDPGNFGLRIYVDGALAGDFANVSFPFADAEARLFNVAGAPGFSGELDEFRFWAHARTQPEILADMNRELFGFLEVQRPGGNAIANGGSDAAGSPITGVPLALDYTLVNTGGRDLTLGSPCVSFANAVNCAAMATIDPAGNVVTPAGSDTAQIEITAGAVGPFSVDVQFASDDPDTPLYTVTVSGSATGIPVIEIERPLGNAIPHQGGDTVIDAMAGLATNLTYTIRNSGSATLNITGQGHSAASNCNVTVQAPASASVGVGLTTTMDATVVPTTPGSYSFTLEVNSNDPGVPVYEIFVSGTAVAPPTATPNQAPVDYGAQNVDTTSAVFQHVITNTGGADLTITAIGKSGAHAADWGFTPAASLPITLAPSAQLAIDGTFTPGGAGARGAALEITSDSGGIPSTVTTVGVTGTGTTPVLSTADVSYPDTNVGLSSPPFTHTITNTGDGPAVITGIQFTGGNHASDWSIVPPLPVSVPANGSVTFEGEFTPGAVGARDTTVEVAWNYGGGVNASTTTANVTGTGTLASVVSSPDPAGYGSVLVGNSNTISHSIENTGTGPGEVTLIELVGGDSGLWSLSNGPATPFVLLPGAANAASIDGTFTPVAAGSFSTTLRIHWTLGGGVNPATTDVTLTGSATAPDLAPAQNPVDYGSVDLGQSSGFTPHVIENNGTAPARVTGIVKGGADGGDFNVLLPSFPQTINPSSNLTFFGTFTPSRGGLHTATLTVSWDNGGPPTSTFVINLEGTGNAPSSVTGLDVGIDNGGPVPVTAFINAGSGQFVDVAVTYSGGANPGPAVIAADDSLTINGNVIEDVPANTQISFLWDAYATERHHSASNYVLTLSPSVQGAPGTSASSAPVSLDRGWAKHATPFGVIDGRFGHVSVFDSANDRMIVFGGKNDDGQLVNDVWAYEQSNGGSGWRQLNPAGVTPSARQYAAAVYDSARGRMILFGGLDGAYLNDAWELDLTRGSEAWLQIATGSPAAPAPRFGHAMVHDAAGDRALIFGGRQGGTHLNDVWALDLSPGAETWGAAAITTSGTPPAGRWGHAGVLDAINNRLVAFGGQTTAGQVDEVWELSLGATPTWSALAPSGTPGARHFMTCGYDASNNAMIVQSGYQGANKLSDTWALSLGASPAWSQLADDPAAAAGRVVGTAVYDASRGRMLVYGGLGSITLSDLSFLDLSGTPSWDSGAGSTAGGAGPDGRWGAAMAFDTTGQRLVLWGGKDDTTYFNDLWAFDGAEWSTLSANAGPPARVYPAYTYDSVGNRLFIHGGQLASGAETDDLWVLDLATATWTQLSSGGAGPRMRHAMVYDNTNNRVVVHGGSVGSTTLSDAFSFTIGGAGWNSIAVTGINARYGHAAVYDSVNGRAVFFGGRSGSGNHNDLWAFDLDPFSPTWTDVTPAGTAPAPRALFAMAGDTSGGRAWIHGGENSNQLGDLWQLDLAGAPSWTDITPAGGPLPRITHAAAFDGNAGLYVGFGRADDNAAKDLWLIDTSSPASGYAQPATQDAPPALVTSNVALDAANNRLIAFSGIADGVHEPGTYALDLSSPVATWTRLSPGGAAPSPRRAASMVYDGSTSPPRMILYGGRQEHDASTVTDELWALELSPGNEQWVQLTPTILDDPGPRTQHAAVVDGAGRMIVFGGSNDSGTRLGDVFALDLATLTWSEIITAGTGPTPRIAHAAVYDGLGARNRMIVHGGYNGATALGDAYVLDLNTNTWASYAAPGGPGALYYQSMVVDPAGGRALLFGGWDGAGPRNELFELDLAADAWSVIAPTVAQPQERWAHAAAWDAVDGRMVIAGGYLDGEVEATEGEGAADTWFWGD